MSAILSASTATIAPVPTLLLITSDPSTPLAALGYRYAHAYMQALKASQEATLPAIHESSDPPLMMFFYGDAANTANGLRWQVADRDNITSLWQQLSAEFNVPLKVCVSTALIRGVTDADNAGRHQLSSDNLAQGFELVGLGELAAQMTAAQKVLQF